MREETDDVVGTDVPVKSRRWLASTERTGG
jgi:hypothetical protein